MEHQYKVSIIITTHNYGKYLKQCLESALNQRYDNYEIVVVNDGSTDNTAEILEHYQEVHRDKFKVITLDGVGLAKACNIGVRSSSGKYVVRCDADDYFDENLLFIEANILDKDKTIHMVFPDYYRVNKYGEIIDYCRKLKVNAEVKLLDRSPLAAGAMFRRKCFDVIGGYNEELRYQEDYDFWIRFIDKFNVYNVNLPLMYYRQHGTSMSTNYDARMEARRYVKKKFVVEKDYRKEKKILGFIPATGVFRHKMRLAIRDLCEKPVIAYTIEEALKVELFDRVIVSTEDHEVGEIAKAYGAEVPFLRPRELAKTSVQMEDVLKHALNELEKQDGYHPDIIAVLHIPSPFKKEKHITEAIDTLLLYNADSVISVVEDITFHWKPGEFGLTPVGYQKRFLREDKELIYKENGAIYVLKSDNIYKNTLLGTTIGYIEMFPYESLRLESEYELWIAENMIKNNRFHF